MKPKIQIGRQPTRPPEPLIFDDAFLEDYVHFKNRKHCGKHEEKIPDERKKFIFVDFNAKLREFDQKIGFTDQLLGSSRNLHSIPQMRPFSPLPAHLTDKFETPAVSTRQRRRSLEPLKTQESQFVLQKYVKGDELQRQEKLASAVPASGTYDSRLGLSGPDSPTSALSPLSPQVSKFHRAQSSMALPVLERSVEVDEVSNSVSSLPADAVTTIVGDRGQLKDIHLLSEALAQRPLSARSYQPAGQFIPDIGRQPGSKLSLASSLSALEISTSRRALTEKKASAKSCVSNLLSSFSSFVADDALMVEEESHLSDDDSLIDVLEAPSRLLRVYHTPASRRAKTERKMKKIMSHIQDVSSLQCQELQLRAKRRLILLANFDSSNDTSNSDQLDRERDCLVGIFEELGGEHWKRNDHWCSSQPLREWFGVVVSVDGFVVELQLSSNNLKGTFPDVSGLHHLEALHIDDNKISGYIPGVVISKVPNLEVLSAQRNQLNGEIPFLTLASLKNLREVWLTNNRLEGVIHPKISSNKALTHLCLHNNQLTGTIPHTLSKLMSLRVLLLGDNQLEGSIPDSLKSLFQLTHLSLHNNLLTGTIPEWLEDLDKLRDLHLYGNSFVGFVPMSAEQLFEEKLRKRLERISRLKQLCP